MKYPNGSLGNVQVTSDRKNIGMSKLEKIVVKVLIVVLIFIIIIPIVKIASMVMVIIIRDINYEKYTDSEYVEKDILEYLEERYNEEFIIESCIVSDREAGTHPYYGTVQAYVYPVEHNDEKHKFRVQGNKSKFGIVDYYDTYVDIKLIDEYETLVDPIIGECYDEYKFYVSFPTTWLNKNLPIDTKIEDFNKMEQNIDYYSRPSLIIYLPPSEPRSEMYSVIKELSENNYLGSVYFRWFYYDDDYDRKTRNDLGDGDGYEGHNYENYYKTIYERGKISKTESPF